MVSLMIEAREQTTCQACGSPITQRPGKGHRKRWYGTDACRQRAPRQPSVTQPASSGSPLSGVRAGSWDDARPQEAEKFTWRTSTPRVAISRYPMGAEAGLSIPPMRGLHQGRR